MGSASLAAANLRTTFFAYNGYNINDDNKDFVGLHNLDIDMALQILDVEINKSCSYSIIMKTQKTYIF